jgi:CDP-2,3-bis-(O-geranylgeranyl)-sn-glycerol synthase
MLGDPLHLFAILLLLGVANGTPIFAKKLLGDRFGAPLDGGLKLSDGHRLFGDSKTIRGLVLSIAATAAAAPLFGIQVMVGAGLAAASMLGDLAASFIKRRLGLRLHARALGLDQIPEALLPLLLLRFRLGLGAGDIVLLVALFIMLELVLSRLLYRLGIRDRPY